MGILSINAGNVNINVFDETFNGQKVYHVVGDGKTTKSYEWFFKVTDRYETFISKITMLPLKFIRDINEGGYKLKSKVIFNHAASKAIVDTTPFSIPRCTHDVLSAIYFARNINYNTYKPGDKIPFTIFLDNEVFSLKIKYMGKERINTKMGVFNAIKIIPQLVKGVIFKDADKMTVWVSDDSNHVPLKISSPILVGSIKAELVGYNNLHSPFSSMVSEN